MIIANDVSEADSGFNSERNRVTVIDQTGGTELPSSLKTELAEQLIQMIATQAFAQ